MLLVHSGSHSGRVRVHQLGDRSQRWGEEEVFDSQQAAKLAALADSDLGHGIERTSLESGEDLRGRSIR
jgi:hypothetical protein